MGPAREADFDIQALYDALDAKRQAEGLTWRAVTDAIWKMSEELNNRRRDHPISPSTLTGMPKRGATSCQHALFMLRWLERVPESFIVGVGLTEEMALPSIGPDRRLRWNLSRLYEALDASRKEQQLNWRELAKVLGCTDNQLTGLRTARFATNMTLAMRIVRWLDRPASAFIYSATW
jgi:hypothetical protein